MKMKQCTFCGCYNQETRTVCVDCGRSLSGATRADEAELDAKLEKLTRYSDPFAFKMRHRIIFYASIAMISANILLFNLSLMTPAMMLIANLSFIIVIPAARFPEAMWNIEKFFLSFKVSGEMEPSDWWFIGREIGVFVLFGTGVVCSVAGYLRYYG